MGKVEVKGVDACLRGRRGGKGGKSESLKVFELERVMRFLRGKLKWWGEEVTGELLM